MEFRYLGFLPRSIGHNRNICKTIPIRSTYPTNIKDRTDNNFVYVWVVIL